MPPTKVNSRLLSTPSASRSDQARSRILAAAQNVFSTRGYAQAGLRDIASEAEVNVALIGRYFGSKEKLFEMALESLLSATTLVGGPRASFGQSVVGMFLDETAPHANPLNMLLHAAADPVSQAVALGLLKTRILLPLAGWLGPPDEAARAAEILALCAGFFTYRIILPLAHFTGRMDPSARRWLESALQAIVDGEAAATSAGRSARQRR